MIRSIYRTQDGSLQTDLKSDALRPALDDATSVLWLDFQGEAPEECEPILRETFKFHPLAIDDALYETHVPKVDDWSDYLYLALHAPVFNEKSEPQLDALELDIFLGHNYIVTLHEQPIPAIELAWSAALRDERHLKAGPDHLLYDVVDRLVDDYMSMADHMNERIDEIEDRLFDSPSPDIVEHIFLLKRVALRMRRTLSPQREVLSKLARDSYAMIDSKDRVLFLDVYDHMVRLYDINESLRDLLSGALETYLSVINNRMNDAMKTLAVITTLFMPISFVVGFFGMNFFGPPGTLDTWTDSPVFLPTLVALFLVPVGMFLWVRRRNWL